MTSGRNYGYTRMQWFAQCRVPPRYTRPAPVHVGRYTATTARDLRARPHEDAVGIVARDRPIIYPYHPRWEWAYAAGIKGVRPHVHGFALALGLIMQ